MPKKPSIKKVYDEIAEDYVAEYGYGNQMSIPALKRFLKYLPKNATVLDVGCGGGQDSNFLFEQGCIPTGIDLSNKMIAIAKRYAPEIDFKVADIFTMSTRKKFDGIWCMRVFNHISLKDQDKFIKKLNVLLKSGGILYLTAIVSDTKEDYESYDSGNGGLLKKRVTYHSFKNLLEKHGFKWEKFSYWRRNGKIEKKWMEVIVKKI